MISKYGNGTYEISNGTLEVTGLLDGIWPGEFTVIGNDASISLGSYSQNNSSIFNLIFDTNGIATTHVLGAATLDGTWNIIDPGNAPFGVFDVLIADGGIEGVFDSVSLPESSDWSWSIVDSGTTLRVAHVVPEPISSILFIAGGATLGFRRFRKKFKK